MRNCCEIANYSIRNMDLMDGELPFLIVGNLFTVTAFELVDIGRGAVVCTFIGAVEI